MADGSVTEDLTPAGFSATTMVNQYGGADYLVLPNGHVIFANEEDQQLYAYGTGEQEPQRITTAENICLADMVFDEKRNRIICVAEDHSDKKNVETFLAAVSLVDGSVTALARGYDFFSSPRLSPDSRTLSWICWNFPNMPWDKTELQAARVCDFDGSSAGPLHDC